MKKNQIFKGKSQSRDTPTVNEMLNTGGMSTADVLTLANHLWEGLDTPTSLGLALCVRHGDLRSVVEHEILPGNYLESDVSRFARDYQAVKFLSKCNLVIPGLDVTEAASQGFIACEQHCAVENEFWRNADSGKVSLTPYTDKLVQGVREIIAGVLGRFDLEEWLQFCKLGPGVVAFGPKDTTDYVKLSESLGVTEDLSPYAHPLLSSFEGWWDGLSYSGNSTPEVQTHKGGKYTQVPKNAKTNRNIETQPMLNVFLQLGLGQVMRRRLKQAGVNLNDQSQNQRLAQIGSVTGEFATIDLKNASDTVSAGTVHMLLPVDWLHALQLTRTRYIYKENTWTRLHRFSSMGNGYTFELESLIFYAICKFVCGQRETLSVYGDDIIVPAKQSSRVIRALKVFGFTPNLNKTFSTGLFRESCGKDYFNGFLVRPYFMEGVPANDAETVRVANGLARSACRHGGFIHLDARFERAIRFTHGLIQAKLRRLIAYGWPDDDSYLCWTKVRNGLRIVFKSVNRSPSLWFAAKTVVLYRQYKRGAATDERYAEAYERGRTPPAATGKAAMLRLKQRRVPGRHKGVNHDTHYWEQTFPSQERPVLQKFL